MINKLSGLGVALVTPFTNENKVDFIALEKLINHVTNNGVDYLVILGTTAETPVLTAVEKQIILEFVINHNPKQLPIILGIGSNNTAEVVNTIHSTYLNGVDAILSVTPYYNKPTQIGLYEHYKTISKESPLPVILYNVPGRTGVNLTAETTLRLAHEFSNIIAIKEASGNINQMSFILRDCPENFLVISGDDALTLPQMCIGAHGCISVAANAYPAQMSSLIKLAMKGDFKEAAKCHLALMDAFELLFLEGNPVGVKAALSLLNIIDNNLRLPLVPATETLINKLSKVNIK